MNTTSKKKLAQNLWDRAKKHYDSHEYEKVIPILDQIDQISGTTAVEPLILAKVTNTRGAISLFKGEYINVENYFLQSLEYAKKIGDPVLIASRYDNLATAYTQLKKLTLAIDYLELSRQMKEKNADEKNLLPTLLNLTNLHRETGNIQSAEKNLQESFHHIKKYGSTRFLPQYYFNLAQILENQKKKYKDAISAYSKCIKHALQLNDYTTTAKAYTNQGNIYRHKMDWDKALSKYTMALNIAKEHKLRAVDLLASIHLGLIALEKGDLRRGRELYEYVSTHILPTDIDLLLTDMEELKSRLYEAEEQYKPALDAYKKYLSYYKKQYDNDRAQSIQNIQAKYEAEKKDRALEKATLLHAQSELKALRAQMDPHFIFNALSSMRKELLEGNLEGADAYLVRFSKLLRLILDTTRTPNIRLSENIELLHLYIQIEQTRQGNRFDYSITTKDIDPDSTYIPGLILQPLAENAIVHGLYHKKQGQGKLHISFSKTRDTLIIKVRDNGAGRLANRDKAKPGHTSHAMAIIRETLDLTWQGRTVKNYFVIRDLMTKDNINIGTEVTVLLPIA